MSSNICSGKRRRICPMAESWEERGGTSNKERHQEMTSSYDFVRQAGINLPASRNMGYSPRTQCYLSRPKKIHWAFLYIPFFTGQLSLMWCTFDWWSKRTRGVISTFSPMDHALSVPLWFIIIGYSQSSLCFSLWLESQNQSTRYLAFHFPWTAVCYKSFKGVRCRPELDEDSPPPYM